MCASFPTPPFGRPTYAVIDLDAITGNVQATLRHVSDGVSLMAVVKGNAYGHGGPIVAKTAVEAGASALGVATVDEGLEIREYGLTAPILVLGPIARREIGTALRADLSLAVGSLAEAEAIAAAASAHPLGQPRIHIKLDSGMHRYGATVEEVVAICRFVHETDRLLLAGLFTHFAAADGPDLSFTDRQADLLRVAVRRLREEGITPEVVHAANSAALLRSRDYDFDLVRLGVSLYGIAPDESVRLAPGMRPALTVMTELTRIHHLEPGDTVGYGCTYRAESRERVGLVPIGYADGLWRSLSHKAWMGKDGVRLPLRGRICMDQTVINLAEGVSARVGDPVAVMGAATESGAGSLAEIAGLIGTIPYEIATGIGARVPRWYLRDGEYVALMRNGRVVPLDDRAEIEASQPV